MISLNNLTGVASSIIVITAIVAHLSGASRLRTLRLALLLCVVTILVSIPMRGMPLAAYLRGWIGDLSITSLVLLILPLFARLRNRDVSELKASNMLFMLVVLAGVVLYPMALGIGYWDPYRFGFGNTWFLCGLFLLALATSFKKPSLIAMVIALAVLAWSTNWYESRNLWDYLLDPLLVIYAVYALLSRGTKFILK